ncbi:flagellin N-terminal helical domain-containing protein [Dongia deserti]|uniref:flagellin N-terminal helical domain-containing protein n=1 Tax=Dongia deserti TaxID=2268030 RepID=UPI000E65AF34|nr:flagellin [Dongia deserti]
MANNSIPLTSGIRSNLLLLQQTSSLLEKTQLRLATGNKINTALDGPAAFFAAKGLTQRAGDLDGLKDGIGQAISTIKAGDSGITAIESLVEQARGLTTQALGSLGNDANSVKLRNSLAGQYNNVLRQIDKLAQDAGYQGKNLLVGSGLRIDATASSKSAVNALTGISGARATNVVDADTYDISVTGDGAITGNSNDIANAERDRGISNVEVTGFASTSNFNLNSISIKLSGGKGKDKTFTVTEGTQTFTQTFTNAEFNAAKAAGNVLRFSASFNSGTRISFDVDFDAIEDVADTAGVGTSVIEKNVNLQVIAENENGETVTRDGLAALGSGKVSNGENAFAFDSGTARITLDERQILGASKYSSAVSSAYGTGAPAFTSVTLSSGGTVDETLSFSVTGTSFNYTTNNFANFGVTAGGASVAVSAGAGSFALTGAGTNSAATYTIGVNTTELKLLATAAAAGGTEIGNTEVATGLTAANFGVSAAAGFAKNTVSNLSFTFSGSAGAATISLSDGVGGTATATNVNIGDASATTVTFTISGGVNDGATFQLTTAASAASGALDGTLSYKVRGEFTGERSASFDVRGTNAGESATLKTEQLVDGSDANNLTVQLNETNTSTVTVVSQNVQTDGQGLQLDFAQNNWNDRSDIDNAIRQLDAAKLKLRSASSSLSTNSNTLLTRLDFTAAFSDVLKEGAGKLTLADQNEEGANILTLQTRQQLGTISLSLANQAQQAILRLF